MGLREILAELDVRVRGTGAVREANRALDQYVATTGPAITRLELLKVKQQEAAELAGRLTQRIRQLQRAEGDNSRTIEELRIAQIRAGRSAQEYGDKIAQLEREHSRATESVGMSGGGGFVGALRRAFPAIVAVAAATEGLRRTVGGVASFFTETIEMGSELNDVSERMGISARSLQEWRFIADRSGASTESITNAFGRLARGAASNNPAFRTLGVHVRDTSGQLRSQEEIFGDTIEALGRVDNHTRRAALAQQLFGRSGAELLPIIDQGSKEIAALRARFAELGGGLSDDVVDAADRAGNAMDDFRLVTTGLGGVLVANVLPVITRVILTLASWGARIAELVRTSSVMQTALGGLAIAAGALAVAMAPAVAETFALVAPFALLFLAVEDVVTAFRGGESVFGSWVEQIMAALGAPVTFAEAVRGVGVSWAEASATARESIASMLEAIASLQRAMGFDGTETQADAVRARIGAIEARASATAARAELGADVRRRIQGDTFTEAVKKAEPAPAQVESRARRAAGAGAGRAGTTVDASTTIIVNSTADAETVGRIVDGHSRRRLREARDAMHQPEPEPA